MGCGGWREITAAESIKSANGVQFRKLLGARAKCGNLFKTGSSKLDTIPNMKNKK
jgi:hypothetical protein